MLNYDDIEKVKEIFIEESARHDLSLAELQKEILLLKKEISTLKNMTRRVVDK